MDREILSLLYLPSCRQSARDTFNKYQLGLLRQRSLSVRYEKARRGESMVGAPVGFIKAGDRLEEDPDQRMQEAILPIFDKIEGLGSVPKTRPWFREHDWQLPAKQRNRAIAWRRPSHAALHWVTDNPAYGGTCPILCVTDPSWHAFAATLYAPRGWTTLFSAASRMSCSRSSAASDDSR